jgi:hypothetical protein
VSRYRHCHEQFNEVADALLRIGADERTLHDVLAALMDRIGVPMVSFEPYRHIPAIEALFNERGVRRATPEEMTRDA